MTSVRFAFIKCDRYVLLFSAVILDLSNDVTRVRPQTACCQHCGRGTRAPDSSATLSLKWQRGQRPSAASEHCPCPAVTTFSRRVRVAHLK